MKTIRSLSGPLSSSGHPCSLPECSPGIQIGQHATVSRGQPHSLGHINFFASLDASRNKSPAGSYHASCKAPFVKHSGHTPERSCSVHYRLHQPQAKPSSATSHAPSQQPHPSLPKCSLFCQHSAMCSESCCELIPFFPSFPNS